MNSRMHWLIISVLVILLGFCLKTVLAKNIAVTWTGSIPIGVYKINHDNKIEKGKYVLLCLPLSIVQMGKAYLEFDKKSSCPAHTIPLGKKVIATVGDTIKITNSAMIVNHHFYAAPVLKKDNQNRKIARLIKNGTYIAKRVWFYGDGNYQKSWDSRYFGGINPKQVFATLTPILTL